MQSAAPGIARIFSSAVPAGPGPPDRSCSLSYVSEEQVVPQEKSAAAASGSLQFIIMKTEEKK